MVQDSLEFCLREEVEERNWAERVAALKAAYQHVPPTRTPKAAGKKGLHAGPVKGSQAFDDEEEEDESPLPSFVNAGLASIPEALRQVSYLLPTVYSFFPLFCPNDLFVM